MNRSVQDDVNLLVKNIDCDIGLTIIYYNGSQIFFFTYHLGVLSISRVPLMTKKRTIQNPNCTVKYICIK
jgi:hypothetical protein